MKVLYIMSSYNIYGGTPKKTLDLAKHFKEDAIVYVYHNVYPEFKSQFEATGAKIYEGFYGRNIYRHLLKLNRIIKTEKIDIVQTQFSMGEVLGYFVKILNPKIKFVVAFVGAIKPSKPKSLVVNRIYKKSDAFIFISKFVKHEKEKQFPILKNKQNTIIYNGTEKRKIIENDSIVLNKIAVLAIGSLIKLKNIQVLIEAMNLLINDYNRHDINIYITGDGSYREKLESAIIKNGIEKHFFLLGNQINIGGFLEQCDVFVHPSYFEGFGIVVAEAMLAEKPIIVSNAGALPELIENEKSGLIIDPFDAEAWANAIIRIIDDTNLATSLATNALIKAERDYSVLNFTKNYENFYQSLID